MSPLWLFALMAVVFAIRSCSKDRYASFYGLMSSACVLILAIAVWSQ